MNTKMRFFFGVFFLLHAFHQQSLSAQKVKIEDISIIGNNHTKPIVVYKELDFKVGDSLDLFKIAKIFDENEKRLLSIGLFNLCKMNLKSLDSDKNTANIEINVKEGWYIYPAPIFELADRSFNVWVKEMNCNFARVNYGGRLDHLNLTGHRDKLKLKVQTGYTTKYELNYGLPYLFNSWGLSFNSSYAQNKEIGYINEGNKVLFKKLADERVLLRRLRIGMELSNRFNVFGTQYLNLQYHNNRIDDVVNKELNPNYFPNRGNYIQYLSLEYYYKYNKTVFPIYPEGGYAYALYAKKDGLGFGNYNQFSVGGEYEAYKKITKRIILGGKIKINSFLGKSDIPYSNNSALGYGRDALRGYELYVMDGKSYGWYKSSARILFLDRKYSIDDYVPLKAFNVIPIRMYLKLTNEGGYAYEPLYINTNTLNNKFIHGGGPGLDIILYNNALISLEYNFNILGQKSFYYKSSLNF
jgi:outer membrane protein assembly factor BamA